MLCYRWDRKRYKYIQDEAELLKRTVGKSYRKRGLPLDGNSLACNLFRDRVGHRQVASDEYELLPEGCAFVHLAGPYSKLECFNTPGHLTPSPLTFSALWLPHGGPGVGGRENYK